MPRHAYRMCADELRRRNSVEAQWEHVPPNTTQFEYCVSASPRTAEVISTLSQGGGNPSPNGSKPSWHSNFDALVGQPALPMAVVGAAARPVVDMSWIMTTILRIGVKATVGQRV